MSLLKKMFGRKQAVSEASGEPVESLIVNAYATTRALPPMDFPHELLGRRDLSDPELEPHLEGFIGYVMSRGDGQMTAMRYHVWRHLQRVRNHVSFEVITFDLPDVEAWALVANAVLFLPDGSVRAPDMAILLSAVGETDPSATLPYPADTLARRARALDRLAGLELKPPSSMPPAIGEAEVVLKSPADVLRRALALFCVAACGQARETGADPIPAGSRTDNPVGFAALTERETVQVASASHAETAAMTWRYEAANTLLWALGVEAAAIAESDRLSDVDALWLSVAALARGTHTADALRLRPTGEILDALDRTWREHWIIRQARQKGVLPGSLNGDVIAERHVALNWLTGFQNDRDAEWDAIDTPT